jgi:putative acetyltransferase
LKDASRIPILVAAGGGGTSPRSSCSIPSSILAIVASLIVEMRRPAVYSRICMAYEWTIRAEHAGDADVVRAVNTAAFGRPDEAHLVERLRERAGASLGLIATVAEEVVGHILFTPVTFVCDPTPSTIMALAPMSVLPAWQRRGVGSALVREGLGACRAAGHDLVIVVGHPAYYPRLGFVRARPLGLVSDPPFPDEAFMVAELTPGALRGRRGVVVYGEAFR